MSHGGPRVLFVFGLPCAGKTTLAAAVASATGAAHLSVGELIRDERARDPGAAELTEAAFRGLAPYPVPWLSGVIARAMQRSGAERFVVDGGPPLDRVAAELALRVDAVLVLETSDGERRRRFAVRRAAPAGARGGLHASPRADDVDALFEARSAFHRAELAALCAGFPPSVPRFTVVGSAPPWWSLRQALSLGVFAEALCHVEATSPEEIDAASLTEAMPRVLARARAGEAARWEARERPVARDGRAFVLHLKPGLGFPPGALSAIEARLAAAGYRVAAAIGWPAASLSRGGLATAHLDAHYLVAKWGERLVDPRRLPEGGGPFVAAYDDPGAAVHENERLAQAVWLARRRDGAGAVLNHHVPHLVSAYGEPGSALGALLVESARAGAESWALVRGAVVGATDPARAAPGSLRRLAGDGALGVTGTIDLRNNAFHASAGPLEALREAWLWFGRGAADAAASAMGAPARAVDLAAADRPFLSTTGGVASLFDASAGADPGAVDWGAALALIDAPPRWEPIAPLR